MNVKAWIEAMRLRTLPVSLAGTAAGLGYARLLDKPQWTIFALCVVFAVLAQIASNFANEYFDFKNGLDRPGREGPRRGVTEGDITASAMKKAMIGTLASACLVGLSLVYWGGWLILCAGILIGIGVLAYSAGPFPLSHNCLGEAAVILFFGIAPVTLTFYLMTGYIVPHVWTGAIAIGLMGANVLLVNNIRDINDDRAVSKHTIAVVAGRRAASLFYFVNGWIAVWLMGGVWLWIGGGWLVIPSVYIVLHSLLWYRIDQLSRKTVDSPGEARKLNPYLGMTACLMGVYALLFAIAA